MPGVGSHAVTLLWALRSKCDLGCKYCYFGTVDDHREHGVPAGAGRLSHLSRNDLSLADIMSFVATLPSSPVRRVFVAGGEPLIWPPILQVIEAIKKAGVQVVLCTNGIRLGLPRVAAQIVELGVDAVSVSLDSADPVANDRYRPARHGAHGWHDVARGIRVLLETRGADRPPSVGIYSVITRRNISQICQMGTFAADLGCDYYVPQPVSLAPTHPLHLELSLSAAGTKTVAEAMDRLYSARLPLALPPASYAGRLLASIAADTAWVAGCFGGRELFFIEPDGSVWDCPSSLKIAATLAARRRSIRGASARTVFTGVTGCADCALFSRDCVNMWPLMAFGDFALQRGGHHAAQ